MRSWNPCAYVDGSALVGANDEWFGREASFYDAEQGDVGNLARGRLSDLFRNDVSLMHTTIDELAAQEVSTDREQQSNQSQVDYLEAQLESHTNRGVPGTAALMQYDVVVCDMSLDEERDLLAELLTGIMLGWCSRKATAICTKQMTYVVTG